jgi:hypothetical protein
LIRKACASDTRQRSLWLSDGGNSSSQEQVPRSCSFTYLRKRIELDDSLGEAQTDWNWIAAEREHQSAIALNGGYATLHYWYA